MATSPLHQFQIERIVPLEIGGVDISFTNSSLWMVVATLLATALLMLGMRRRALVPGRLQSVAELLYEFVADMVRDNGGEGACKYMPLVFSIFIFILLGNLIGMVPGTFTFTSHIIVTFGLALAVFVFVTLLALVKHGLHFFSFFAPHGIPKVLLLLIVPI